MREWLAGVVGENLAPVVSVILAAAVVILLALVLIGLAKRVFSGTGGIGSRSRAPRLAVLDVTAIDPKRKLVLVRRDEVEHLLLIGGQNDLVVEPTILRGQVPRRPRVDGVAPRREPEIARELPAERVAPPMPPRRVPVVSSADTLAPVVDLPIAEPVSPVSTSPRDADVPRTQSSMRVEPIVEAPSAPRGGDGTRPVDPDRLFSVGAPGRDDDMILAPKPARDVPPPPAGAMAPSPETDWAPASDTGRRAPGDGRPTWMTATPEPRERSQPTQDVADEPTRAALPAEDARPRGTENGAPAPEISASPVPRSPSPRPAVTSPAPALPTRPEPSGAGAGPDLAPSAPAPAPYPAPATPRSMATPTLPVPVRAPTLPLPPLQRAEATPPAPSSSARSLWSPAAATSGDLRTSPPEAVPVERAPTSEIVNPPPPPVVEAAKTSVAPASEARAEAVRPAPATGRGGLPPFPVAPLPASPGTSGSTAAEGSTVPAPVTSAPSSEPDSRQPLSVRSFATTIQERRAAAPATAEPRPVPPAPIAPPVVAAPAAPAVAPVREADTPRVEPVAAQTSATASASPDERDPQATDPRPLTLEEEMERLLYDFTIDVSDRR